MRRYVSEASTGPDHTYIAHTGDEFISDVFPNLDGDSTLIQRRAQVEDVEGRRHQYSEQSRLCIVPAETDSIKENSSVSLGCTVCEHTAIDAPSSASESELVGIMIAAVQLPVPYKPFWTEDIWVRVYLKSCTIALGRA